MIKRQLKEIVDLNLTLATCCVATLKNRYNIYLGMAVSCKLELVECKN